LATPFTDGQEAGLFLGAPAITYVLHLAADGGHRYARALDALDRVVVAHTRRRLDAAHARIDRGEPTSFTEYDLLRGLTGLGALILRRAPDAQVFTDVLTYLVRLTEPLSVLGPGPEAGPLPGWWVGHSPVGLSSPAPGGHANVGLAHGITGPLALLALAAQRGVTVPGHHEAMRRICRWLDDVRLGDHDTAAWPRWVAEGGVEAPSPTVPSWCYGTPGVARAQQLAAVALRDLDRKRAAEQALLHCLSDPLQLGRLHARGLCHGLGGVLRVVQRVAQDADDPAAFTHHLPALGERLLLAPPPDGSGFLEGAAGARLAFADAEASPAGEWDACLLLV
jgi:hypothetical protein